MVGPLSKAPRHALLKATVAQQRTIVTLSGHDIISLQHGYGHCLGETTAYAVVDRNAQGFR